MNNLNSILIEGNLAKDPILRTTPRGTQVCTMCIASNRYYKQDSGFEKEVSFFFVETWGRLAEACCARGKKGRGVRVVGRLKQERWTDSDGKLRSKVTIVAEHVEFRPEFKKDTKTVTEGTEDMRPEDMQPEDMQPEVAEIPYDDLEEESGEEVLAAEDSTLEAVTF